MSRHNRPYYKTARRDGPPAATPSTDGAEGAPVAQEVGAAASERVPRSPRHAELRGFLADLYARVLTAQGPPDHFIGGYFRLRPSIVGGARGFLAATLYALLRQRVRTLLLWRWAERNGSPRFAWPEPGVPPTDAAPPGLEAGLALYRWLREDLGEPFEDALALAREALDIAATRLPAPAAGDVAPVFAPGRELEEFAAAIESDGALRGAPEIERFAARVSLPTDIAARWSERFGAENAERLGLSFHEAAPLDLRVNTLRVSREKAVGLLAKEEIEASPTPWSPQGLRVARKASLKRSAPYRDGLIETQDEGSQIVSLALSPKPGMRVLDACAGGGGKTLHLASLMEGRGQIVARDIDPPRLEAIAKRLGRARLGGFVSLWGPDDPPPAEGFDAILVDAPCLGFGTLRRNPHFAWFGPLPKRLEETSRAQRAILEQYAPLAKPGGIVVYAVCSFELEETSGLIDSFLAAHPEFERDSLATPFGAHGMERLIEGSADPASITLLPTEHGTDGFFVCRLRRKG
jgi:16S rRNA (cytosine967-C5)-methyltransferase